MDSGICIFNYSESGKTPRGPKEKSGTMLDISKKSWPQAWEDSLVDPQAYEGQDLNSIP